MPVSANEIYQLLGNSSNQSFAIFLANTLNQLQGENQGGVVELGNGLVILQGAGAPQDGVTGLDVAALGSLYIDSTNGALYINQDDSDNPTWALESSVTPINALLSGFSSGAGVVSAADSILEAIQKVDGNANQAQSDADAAQATADLALPEADFSDANVTGKLLTGLAAGSATPIAATDSILVALANLQAQIDAL